MIEKLDDLTFTWYIYSSWYWATPLVNLVLILTGLCLCLASGPAPKLLFVVGFGLETKNWLLQIPWSPPKITKSRRLILERRTVWGKLDNSLLSLLFVVNNFMILRQNSSIFFVAPPLVNLVLVFSDLLLCPGPKTACCGWFGARNHKRSYQSFLPSLAANTLIHAGNTLPSYNDDQKIHIMIFPIRVNAL